MVVFLETMVYLLFPLSQLVGCDSSRRDIHYLILYNSVQLIIAKEKNDSIRRIRSAIDDIINKFRFIYNYSEDITVMFGFAISINDFRIFKFQRNPLSEVPLFCSEWFSSSLNILLNRINCLLASFNVGRVLKFYRERDFLIPSTIPRGTWIERVNNQKQIKICYDYFIIKCQQNQKRLEEMKNFY